MPSCRTRVLWKKYIEYNLGHTFWLKYTWDIKGWYHKTFTTLAPESFWGNRSCNNPNGHWIILLHNWPHPSYTSSPQAPLLVHSNARLLHGACQGWHGVHVHLQSMLVGSCSLLQYIKQYSEWNRLCGSVVGKYKLMLWKCLWTRIQSHRKIQYTVTSQWPRPRKWSVQGHSSPQNTVRWCIWCELELWWSLCLRPWSMLICPQVHKMWTNIMQGPLSKAFKSIVPHLTRGTCHQEVLLYFGPQKYKGPKGLLATKHITVNSSAQFSHWQQSHSSQQLQTAELLVRSAMANCSMLLWNCHR